MHIMHCTLWEECKQPQYPHRSWKERTTALMWYCSPTITQLYQVRANTSDFWLSGQYGKYNSYVFFIPPLGPFSLKNAALPLNSLFWSPLTAVHRFDASDMAVPGLYFLLKIFLENHFSQNYCVTLLKNMYRSQIKSWCKLQRCNYLFSVLGGICSKGGRK